MVGKALPAPLAAKWSAGAATQPNTLQAMRKVFEEQQKGLDKQVLTPLAEAHRDWMKAIAL